MACHSSATRSRWRDWERSAKAVAGKRWVHAGSPLPRYAGLQGLGREQRPSRARSESASGVSGRVDAAYSAALRARLGTESKRPLGISKSVKQLEHLPLKAPLAPAYGSEGSRTGPACFLRSPKEETMLDLRDATGAEVRQRARSGEW